MKHVCRAPSDRPFSPSPAPRQHLRGPPASAGLAPRKGARTTKHCCRCLPAAVGRQVLCSTTKSACARTQADRRGRRLRPAPHPTATAYRMARTVTALHPAPSLPSPSLAPCLALLPPLSSPAGHSLPSSSCCCPASPSSTTPRRHDPKCPADHIDDAHTAALHCALPPARLAPGAWHPGSCGPAHNHKVVVHAALPYKPTAVLLYRCCTAYPLPT